MIPWWGRSIPGEYEDVLTKLPDYCGEEVTGVKEWSNSSIAKSIMENY